MQIKDLPEVVTAADSDSLLIDTAKGTKRIQKQNLTPSVDEVPTQGSNKPVASGGVYNEFENTQKKEISISKTLLHGTDTVSFQDDRLSDDKHISIFSDEIAMNPYNASYNNSSKTLVLTYDITYPDDHVIVQYSTLKICLFLHLRPHRKRLKFSPFPNFLLLLQALRESIHRLIREIF